MRQMQNELYKVETNFIGKSSKQAKKKYKA
uniref:Uncharacterized protein n=1 Tax=Rhizophora mucronata TaxID=61149 RepID=A0A2P2NYX3_RHIMU